jgi:hypothetical protein
MTANAETEASGCFCDGALVAEGEFLFRQVYGIEVFDISDRGTPTLLRTIEESGVSDGDLVVFDGWLVSSVNIWPAVNVYSLGDPTTPALMGSLELPLSADGLPTGMDLATRDDVLAVAYWDDETTSVIQLLSLDAEGQPSIERSLELEGQIRSMALGEGTLLALLDLGPNDAPQQELRKLDLDGAVVATFDTTAEGVVSGVVGEWQGTSFLAGGGASNPTLVVVQWSGEQGKVVGSWTDPEGFGAASLAFLAPGLLAVGGGNLDGRVAILDVFDPTTLTFLGSVSAARTEHLAAADGAVYVSGNDTLTAIAVSCE